jgi:hypothetical protein
MESSRWGLKFGNFSQMLSNRHSRWFRQPDEKVFPSFCCSVSLSFCRFVVLPFCFSVFLSFFLSVSLSLRPSVFLSFFFSIFLLFLSFFHYILIILHFYIIFVYTNFTAVSRIVPSFFNYICFVSVCIPYWMLPSFLIII